MAETNFFKDITNHHFNPDAVLDLSKGGRKALIISDLHMGTGKMTISIENFIGLRSSGLFIAVLLISDGLVRIIPNVDTWIMKKPAVLRWAGYYALIITILVTLLLSLDSSPVSSQFIYFTF